MNINKKKNYVPSNSVQISFEKVDILTLEKVQRRAACFVTGYYQRRATNMISSIGWQSLEERKAIARLTIMYKIVHGHVHVFTAPSA